VEVSFLPDNLSMRGEDGQEREAVEKEIWALEAIQRELAGFFTAELGFGAITAINFIDGVRIRFDNRRRPRTFSRRATPMNCGFTRSPIPWRGPMPSLNWQWPNPTVFYAAWNSGCAKPPGRKPQHSPLSRENDGNFAFSENGVV